MLTYQQPTRMTFLFSNVTSHKNVSFPSKKKCYIKFLYFEMLIINELDEKYVNKRIRSNIGRCPRLQAPVVRAHRGEPIRAETVQHERREYRERAVNSSDAAERIFARSERRVSHRLAGRPAGRSVGRSGSLTRTVADPSVDYSGDLT